MRAIPNETKNKKELSVIKGILKRKTCSKHCTKQWILKVLSEISMTQEAHIHCFSQHYTEDHSQWIRKEKIR